MIFNKYQMLAVCNSWEKFRHPDTISWWTIAQPSPIATGSNWSLKLLVMLITRTISTSIIAASSKLMEEALMLGALNVAQWGPRQFSI